MEAKKRIQPESGRWLPYKPSRHYTQIGPDEALNRFSRAPPLVISKRSILLYEITSVLGRFSQKIMADGAKGYFPVIYTYSQRWMLFVNVLGDAKSS